jgi:hypothetical protein
MSQYSNYNGDNGPFSPNRVFHEMEYGYSIVEINGDSSNDCDVTIQWKKRVINPVDSSSQYVMSDHVIQYSVCSVSENPEKKKEKIQISPNPVGSAFFIEGVENEFISICDLSGKQMKQVCVSNNWIDVSDLQSGLYFIRTKQGVMRFVKN